MPFNHSMPREPRFAGETPGARIRELRLQHGMTQLQLACALLQCDLPVSVHTTRISDLETSGRGLEHYLPALAQLFNVSEHFIRYGKRVSHQAHQSHQVPVFTRRAPAACCARVPQRAPYTEHVQDSTRTVTVEKQPGRALVITHFSTRYVPVQEAA